MPPTAMDTSAAAVPSVITMKDVARHNHKDDCWIVIEGKVYDATQFLEEHPGGRVLATWAGSDATEAFEAFHSEEAQDMLSSFFVGPLADPAKVPLLEDFHKLKLEFAAEGLFEPSYAYFTFKVLFNLGMLAATVWAMWALGGGMASAIVGAVSVAVFWQQCGWLSHDFLHHQVFDDRWYGHAMGYFLGNVLQGFSVTWWVLKHSTHHAIPNVMAGVRDGDPDAQTMPLLAWADAFLEGELEDGMPPFLIRYQHITFLPLLCVARISWVIQSLLTALGSDEVPPHRRTTEVLTLVVHYAYYAAMAYFLLDSWKEMMVFVLLSQAVAGLCLGTVFTINHNSMEMLDSDAINHTNFVAMQYRTTRNISPSFIGDWFTGGLSYQIEHHLFPTLPRHRFKAIAPRVEALAAKHGLVYQHIGFFAGLIDVIRCLRRVATNHMKAD
ncbi:Delta6 fatty acid desaturase [Thecamonas trahens ATCC 50062]|uniref:Delta6 fatty acid desaturase n=1 Tax=Thecamonas trahens ATCC 50062 TaxID=461836 RepID=A0A0L0DV76_THETB|nr:Delta6 fatty acid desaturase [Thecamonas trahens ATCC 50062]KNC55443.1 Delta6 fatty acid desaturase [Thecamonas trahens ATCC 50062]|eukprot:XP_013752980.1 Delta6 fatty acid desaturase [Thecamonas trahens ATCC 50062]